MKMKVNSSIVYTSIGDILTKVRVDKDKGRKAD
jgi:hypothetical protein